ncbi:MAG: N-6 DNA methylase, partial [Gammaproteobacteria bacterium]|nr:N-6 DNA methylase [Gammaproteobacteria bacterium]
VLKKCRVHDNDILFIDASQHFEKSGNQNSLTDAHVEKIVDVYRKREAIDKYAYVASLDEVRENDHNLNIPRYIDTFEEEEPVDLKAVVKHLNALEMDMQETDKTIAEFCKELEIESPV